MSKYSQLIISQRSRILELSELQIQREFGRARAVIKDLFK